MNGYTEPARPRPIVLGLDRRDARDYIARHPDLVDARPESVGDRRALQGYAVPVYATPRARLHHEYADAYRAAQVVHDAFKRSPTYCEGYQTEGRIA